MSANPLKPTAYAVFFCVPITAKHLGITVTQDISIAHWTSKNGNIVDLGRVCMSYLGHNLLPADACKGELGVKEITIRIYQFEELSDIAKDNARKSELDYEWWDSIYDDAKSIGLKITSFELDRNRYTEGYFIIDANQVASSIIANHGESCETYKDAQVYLKARAELEKLDVHLGELEKVEIKLEELEDKFLRTLLEDYSIILQKEYEYLYSTVDESICANGYEFTENGQRQ